MHAIEFRNISKQYRLGLVGTGTLYGDLNRWWAMNVRHEEDPYLRLGQRNDRTVKSDSEFVWALKDINLTIDQGEVVGFIGSNGAGKSTLLKLLSKITAPTTGEIRTRGRIGTLLEVGTGFHPEMTGRENIYMNGAVLGMTRNEINTKLDEIIDFSGCERYIDTPVKRYSSGMIVRLGFAVAAHLDPEIMVVDEVLAIGDAEFQKKAIGKMQDVARGEGRTVLFVSHNMAAVRKLCKRGVLLDKGMTVYDGDIDTCIERYTDVSVSEFIGHTVVGAVHRKESWPGEVRVIEVQLLGNPSEIATDESLDIILTLECNDHSVQTSQYGVIINDSVIGRLMYCHTQPVDVPEDHDVFQVRLHLSNLGLAKGSYTVDIMAGIFDFGSHNRLYDRVVSVLSFRVGLLAHSPKREYSHWNSHYCGYVLHAGDETVKGELIQ